MKFTQMLDMNMVPEWRNQYIDYKSLDVSLSKAADIKTAKSPRNDGIDCYFNLIKSDQIFADYFSRECHSQLDKINNFHREKLIEVRSKYNNLQDQLEQVQSSAIYNKLYPILIEPSDGTERSSPSPTLLEERNLGGIIASISGLLNQLKSGTRNSFRTISSSFMANKSKSNKDLICGHKTSISTCSTHSIESSVTISSNETSRVTDPGVQIVSDNSLSQQVHSSKFEPMDDILNCNHLLRSRSPSDCIYPIDTSSYNYQQQNLRSGLSSPSNDQVISHFKKKIRNLKFAFRELYFNLVLFEQYTQLNHTGFEQILRKHDRMFASTLGRKFYQEHVQTAEFYINLQVIDQLIEGVEHIYTLNFENGNRRRAIDKLSVPSNVYKPSSPKLDFRVGFELGMTTVLFIVVVIIGLTSHTVFDWRTIFRLYRSPLILIIFLFQSGISILIWKHYKINHVLIFELNPRNNLSSQHFFELASIFGIVWSISVICFLYAEDLDISPSLCPLVIVMLAVSYLFNPTATCHYRARFWLLKVIGRIFTAPLNRIKFADFWIADQLVSIVPLFLDLEYLSCFYTSGDAFSLSSLDADSTNRCVTRNPQDLVIRTIVAALPAWFRCAQCIRRWRDENWLRLHLANAGKYLCMVSVVVLSSVAQYNSTSFELDTLHIIWISAAIFTSGLTAWWDVIYDFGLFNTYDTDDGEADSRYDRAKKDSSLSGKSYVSLFDTATKKTKLYPFLRKDLVYPAWVYYFAIVENSILRFGWIITISLTEFSGIEAGLVVSLLAPLEMFRRFVWNCIRLENEQLNNCGLFRAVRDIPIEVVAPIDESHLDKVIMMMDSKDGPSKRNRLMKRRALRPDGVSFMVLHMPSDDGW